MIKTSITLQELRRKIYIKGKADKSHRFWGLYFHISKKETLEEAYRLSKANKGSHGLDEITFDEIKQNGKERFLQNIHDDLTNGSYQL